jgi:hypothetical protein
VVCRHGPALAHGLSGEIDYILTRKPRSVVKSLAIGLALGLLYLGFIRAFQWDTKSMVSSLAMWFLLTVFALALAQQPKVRRALMREIADYSSNAEARAYADEAARTAGVAAGHDDRQVRWADYACPAVSSRRGGPAS